MSAQIMLRIPGPPTPKGRPRFTRQGRAYTPAKTKTYEDEVAMLGKAAMKGQEPFRTPVAVYVRATFLTPASYSKTRTDACLAGYEQHIKRPDLDNIVKAITDGLNGVVYHDDSQIVVLHATKMYGTAAMVEVTVKEELK